MEMQEIIADVRSHYDEGIKPLLEGRNYNMAGFELGNLVGATIKPNALNFATYPSGKNFVGSAILLEKELKKQNPDPESKISLFEGFLSQAELSIKSKRIGGRLPGN